MLEYKKIGGIYMSVDFLQDRIRKMKNPTVINFFVLPEHIPMHILETTGNFVQARQVFFETLLDALHEVVPAVRFSYPVFSLAGSAGLDSLSFLLNRAKDLGYYVFLDGVEALSEQEAVYNAQQLMGANSPWCFDGLIMPIYIGSEGVKPYLSMMKDNGKDLFAVVRTGNRSATELQDLLTGTRLMHLAAADVVDRFTKPLMTKCAYSQLCMVAGASSMSSLRTLREKYKDIFILIDGCDYSNANAKNCSAAFDQIGHGAAACAGLSVVAAWQDEGDENAYLDAATEAAKRLKKNLLRYVTIL